MFNIHIHVRCVWCGLEHHESYHAPDSLRTAFEASPPLGWLIADGRPHLCPTCKHDEKALAALEGGVGPGSPSNPHLPDPLRGNDA